MTKAVTRPSSVQPARLRVADAGAIQALANGQADEAQQKHALTWILKKACMEGDWAYQESQRETDIALGRQFVAQQIVGAIAVNISALRKLEERANG